MEERIIFAGFGGQGVLFAGKLLAQAAMLGGKHVTWIPSYGPEMRGGTANCSVVIADKKIGSPIVDKPTLAVVMNVASFDKFHPLVKKGGIIIVNTSTIKEVEYRDDIKVFEVPANQMAEKCGTDRAANMVVVGAVIASTKVLPLDVVMKALEKEVGGKRPELLVVNKQALTSGLEFCSG